MSGKTYKISKAQQEEYLRLRNQLDTQERERLMKEIEEAGADAAGFSVAGLRGRGALYQLESRIRRLDQILDNCRLIREDDEADRLARELAGIKSGTFSGEGAFLQTEDACISLQQQRREGVYSAQLTLRREGQAPRYAAFRFEEETGKEEYLILGKSLWEDPEPEKDAAARYTSLAQAAGSAYLPYLLILYYLVQDEAHADELGIPTDDYNMDEDLYRFLAQCPPWMPLPQSREGMKADPPEKRPMRAAQIPVPEDGVLLRAEYGERFGFEYQIFSADAPEEDEDDPMEEYYHLRELLESKYLRYYLMLLAAIEQPGKAFQDL